MTSIAVYTCAIGNYDWIHRPLAKSPRVDFLRFADRKPLLPRGWMHRDIVGTEPSLTSRKLSRFAKMRPHKVVPEYEVAIWIDSSVQVVGDVMPLVRNFMETGADVAMFPHPSGRTVAEEFAFAIKARRIRPEFYEAAERQQERYAAAGVLDHKVMECTIILYRLANDLLRVACENWWHELVTYADRDQVSQPFAMRDERLRIHRWDWHFDDPNPYFRRLPHRPKALAKRLKVGAHCLADQRLDYRLVHYAFRGGRAVRRVGQSFESR